MRLLAAITVSFLLPGPGTAATLQEDWLPPAVAEATVQQLAQRISQMAGRAIDEPLVEGARSAVAGLRARLESWGEEGVLQRAPAFPDLGVPASGQPHLDAMARYQICNLVLMLQQTDPAFQDDTDARLTAVMGLSAFSLAIIYLRQPFVAQGGTASAIEAFLTGAEFEPVLAGIQTRPELRTHAESQCEPVLKMFFD